MRLLFVLCLYLPFLSLFSDTYDVLIAGGGPAGLTASIYTSRLGLKTFVAEGTVAGGQLSTTHVVENFPGFPNGINGPVLISNMREQAIKYLAKVQSLDVKSMDFSTYPYRATLSNNEILETKSLIIATGSSPKLLGLDSEASLFGQGVSTCAVCDAPLYKDQNVLVVGGGDSAFEEALLLSQFAKKVTIVHRSDTFRASNILRERVASKKNISIKTFTKVINISDPLKGYVDGATLENTQSGKLEKISCDGVFIAIGQIPNTSWLQGSVTTNSSGIIIKAPQGVFAAGDVVDNRYKQAITASGSGCKAALDAYQYLELKKGN